MRGVLVGLLATALIGACSSDGDNGQARTVDSSTSTTTERSATSTTSQPTEDVALADVVVQLSDLPTGWTVSAPDNEGDDSFCEDRDPFNEVPPQDEAESAFRQSEFGPFVAAGVSRYKTDDEAAGVMDLLTDMANTCQTFTQVDDDGTETEYTITGLSFPDLKADTFAFRMAGTTILGPLALDVVAVRDGALVIALINGGLGNPDSDLTESLVRTMTDRL